MPDTGYLIAAVATAVAVTWALRALPFALLAPLRSSPLVVYLRKVMPVGVMVVLTVYTLRDFDPHLPDRAWPTALALAFTVVLHLWRRNVLLSIAGGTVVHVLLASAVFG
ncbi:branched-chain amino acid transporter permease [Streptomyces huiliensis]|uniref:branched-chain amino acid transporter permease n=1 Tax=Streptomyces huiliensis TaxID=2876027 RepID=UPI001CBB106A|nr:AzlD domain-containing protein [Streptomyces huiliensis]MBZ4321924.1 AzlD domain-containing protein [Streptomyces huiliensis]